jgi:hypothetical protein
VQRGNSEDDTKWSCLSPKVSIHQEVERLGLQEVKAQPHVIGGRVKQFLHNWEQITQDQTILDMVKGYEIPFVGKPPDTRVFSPKFGKDEERKVEIEILALMEKGAIRMVEQLEDQFVGHIFLREKKDGSQRPVFNLKKLNASIQYKHFKMEGFPLLKTLIKQGDWFLKLDMKDAYFCVSMAERHKRFLRFQWKSTLYEFQCLPFGLASAPRDFTKLLKPLIAMLRRIGIRLIIYLDDILLMNQNPEELRKDGKTLAFLIERLGFLVNKKKSVMIPSQEIEFLGMKVNSIAMEMALPNEKIQKIKEKCQQCIRAQQLSVRQLAEIIGMLSAAAAAVLPAPLQYRHLQLLKIRSLISSQSYESKVTLTPESKEELRWWVLHLQQVNGKSIISPGPDVVIQTDASLLGWGAVSNGRTVRGHWTPEEQEEPINALELRAVKLGIMALLKGQNDLHVHVKTDNITAAVHINKMGGTKSERLVKITKQLWTHCLENNLRLTATYLPGKQNVIADRLSRQRPDASDWQLDPAVFRILNQTWGPFGIDLFASRTNRQLTDFISWKLDPEAQATDALLIRWKEKAGYAFPPFALISRCLAKVMKEETSIVLVAPTWPTQPWYPTLLNMLSQQPILLPQYDNLLKSPVLRVHPLLQTKALHLAAWKITGEAKEHLAFLRKQPTWSQNPGEQEHVLLTTAPGRNGVAGVVKGKLIRFRPLWEKS